MVCNGSRSVLAVQVSYDISTEKTRKREIAELVLAAKKTGCDKLLLLTDYHYGGIEEYDYTIAILHNPKLTARWWNTVRRKVADFWQVIPMTGRKKTHITATKAYAVLKKHTEPASLQRTASTNEVITSLLT